MSDRIRIALALVAAWGLVLAAIGATLLLVGADLSEQERALVLPVLRERAASVIVVSLLLLVPLVFILKALFRRYVAAPRQLAEDARIMQTANPGAPGDRRAARPRSAGSRRASTRSPTRTHRCGTTSRGACRRPMRGSSRSATGWRR